MAICSLFTMFTGGIGVFLICCILGLRYYFNGGLYRRDCQDITVKLHGKTAIITGGIAGIGKETAIDFARRGARVIIGDNNQKKAESAVKEIKRRSGSSNVMYYYLDLSNQDSVRNFANIILKEATRIDYLINNAAMGMAAEGHRTKEGYNMVFAVNHFGHFLLTMMLLDRLKKSAPSRIVNLTSIAHTWVKAGEMHFAPKDDKGRIYPALQDYNVSKLANVLFTKELARRLDGTGVTTYAVHPGCVTTSMVHTMNDEVKFSKLFYWFGVSYFYLVGSNSEVGAQTTIYCALEESITHLSGRYFVNNCLAKESELAHDKGLAKKLWEVSCEATGM